jgi:plasmid replication initiation protein
MSIEKIEKNDKDIIPFGDLWKHNDYIKILQFKIQMNIHQQKIFDAILSTVQQMKREGKIEEVLKEGDLELDYSIFKQFLMKGSRIQKINRKDLVDAIDQMTSIKHSWDIDTKIGSFVIFQRAEIDFETNKLNITFGKNFRTENLIPASNYTYFAYDYLNKFKSQYARVLYQYLKMLIGKDIKKPFRTDIKLEIEYLRLLLGVNEKEHKEYFNNASSFIKRCIEPAKKEINVYSDIKCDYRPIKEGRSITHVEFTFFPRDDLIIEAIPDNSEKIKQVKETLSEISIFKDFKDFIIDKYSGREICNNVEGFLPDVIISLTDSGYLKNTTSDELLSKAKSLQVWEYLFKHQNRVGEIIEITEYVLVKKFIGNTFTLERENPLTNKIEDFLYVIENIEEESKGSYRLHVKDKLDPAIPTVKSKSLLNYEQLQKLNYV